MTASTMDSLFIALLAVWTGLSVLRFVRMYELTSPLQRWRRWDGFRLIPVGAFFSPRPPAVEPGIILRDILPDGRVTPWTEVPRIRPRRWWHALWNPQKHVYKAKLQAARALLAAGGHLSKPGERLPATLHISEPYLALLRYATGLPRLTKPRATQFGVIEVDVLTREVRRTILSSIHEA